MIPNQLSQEQKKPLSTYFAARVMSRIQAAEDRSAPARRWLLRVYWLLAAGIVFVLCGPAGLAFSAVCGASYFALLDAATQRRHLRLLGIEPGRRAAT